jgi:peptide/nickel transport system substrate-binding protein
MPTAISSLTAGKWKKYESREKPLINDLKYEQGTPVTKLKLFSFNNSVNLSTTILILYHLFAFYVLFTYYVIMKRISRCVLFTLSIFLSVFFSSSDQTIIYIRGVDSTTLEPSKSEDLYSSEVIANMFEGLVRFKKGTYDIEPCLATKWEMSNGHREWIFYLRKGVRFHNQKTFDSNSVVATFKRRLETEKTQIKRQWFFFPNIESVEAIDRVTVRIMLKKPYAPLLPALTDPAALIVAPESYQENGAFKPIGTGAFSFESWEKGKTLILKRNPDYWDGEIPISRIIFKIIASPASRTLQLRNGNADVLRIESAVEFEEFLGRIEVETFSVPSRDVHYLVFNTKKHPLNKVDIRQAFAHLINKDGLVKHIYQKVAIPAVTPIPPSFFGFNYDIKDYQYDIAKTRSLLRKAGLEAGFTINLFFSERNLGLHKIANIITTAARKVKIRVNKIPLPFKELVKRCDHGDHDMALLGWVGPPDPDFFFYPLFTMTPGNKNRAFYDNPTLLSLLNKARETFDEVQRAGYYRKVQEIIHKDLPWIPLFHQLSVVAHRKCIEKLYITSNDYLDFKYTFKHE